MGHFPPKGRHPLLHTAVAVFAKKRLTLAWPRRLGRATWLLLVLACTLGCCSCWQHARLLLVPWPFSAAAAEIKDFPQTEVNRGWGKFSGERPLLGPKALPRAWAGALLLRACARVFC